MVISWRLSLSVSFLRIVSECPSCPGTFSPFVLIHVVSLSFKVTLRVLNHLKPTISLETGVSVAHFCFPYCCLVVCLFVLLGTLLWCCCSVAKSYPALCNPVDCSLPGVSGHGVFQARILEWAPISFSRESCQTRDQTHISCTGRWILYY